jgi:hypothetical protein
LTESQANQFVGAIYSAQSKFKAAKWSMVGVGIALCIASVLVYIRGIMSFKQIYANVQKYSQRLASTRTKSIYEEQISSGEANDEEEQYMGFSKPNQNKNGASKLRKRSLSQTLAPDSLNVIQQESEALLAVDGNAKKTGNSSRRASYGATP